MRPFLGGRALRATRETGKDLESLHSCNLVFFDLETTGLSGGSGTIAFLAAFGGSVPVPGGRIFEIRQYFLADYPGEGDFLDAVLCELKQGSILASYNGRSFDEPLLRTRCVLNRRSMPSLPHADFLPAARRLWKDRFPDCSLGTLERGLLGRGRGLDVPGARIPEIWLEFVKQGSHPLLEAVLAHNAADIESLACLAAECSRVHSDPDRARDCRLTALGSLWLGLEPPKGERVLERSFREGDGKAGEILLKHYRRQERVEDYERILSALCPSWFSCIERAKHAEHRRRDPESALTAARAAEGFADTSDRKEALSLRLSRLERKARINRRSEA